MCIRLVYRGCTVDIHNKVHQQVSHQTKQLDKIKCNIYSLSFSFYLHINTLVLYHLYVIAMAVTN